MQSSSRALVLIQGLRKHPRRPVQVVKRRESNHVADLVPVLDFYIVRALQELEIARLVKREVVGTRPPSAVYRATGKGRRIAQLV